MKTMAMTAPLTAATRRGDKTQTRRLPDPRKVTKIYGIENGIVTYGDKKNMTSKKASIADFINKFSAYKAGEIVAIREPAVIESYSIDATGSKCTIKYLYKADEDYARRVPESMELPERFFDEVSGVPTGWVQRHMGGVPNGCISEMLRTFVRIVDVRLERLDEISEEDAKAEGCKKDHLYEWSKMGNYKFCKQCAKALLYSASSTQEAKEPCTGVSYWSVFRSLWESIDGRGTFNDRYVFVYVYALVGRGEFHDDVA